MTEESKDKKLAIKVSAVSKKYRLGQYGRGTLQGDLQAFWARIRKKEDPNSKIKRKGKDGEEFYALKNIDLTLYQGETLGIIGRNGAGKSTLLKLISRVTAPTTGSIDIHGRIASMLEVGTGFHPEMTGRENVYLNGSILGMSKKEIDDKMDEIIEFSEIGEFIDTPVKRYSSGMYVKLAFSVAAHLDSDIMIMDEVLAVGDVMFQKKCLEKIHNEAAGGKTVLFVSHNMNSVRRLCDRCAVLKDGEIVFIGETERAIETYLNTILVEDVKRDLSEWPRAERLSRQSMHLDLAEYVGKDSIRFKDGEPMRMHLRWRALEDYEDLCLRAEVWTVYDFLQASYVLKNVSSAKAGDEEDLYVELDVSQFAHATYKFKFSFFFQDEYGRVTDTDRVIGLFMERVPADGEEVETWDVTNWGYIKMDNAKVVDEEAH